MNAYFLDELSFCW